MRQKDSLQPARLIGRNKLLMLTWRCLICNDMAIDAALLINQHPLANGAGLSMVWHLRMEAQLRIWKAKQASCRSTVPDRLGHVQMPAGMALSIRTDT